MWALMKKATPWLSLCNFRAVVVEGQGVIGPVVRLLLDRGQGSHYFAARWRGHVMDGLRTKHSLLTDLFGESFALRREEMPFKISWQG